jgi:hypothetical protein
MSNIKHLMLLQNLGNTLCALNKLFRRLSSDAKGRTSLSRRINHFDLLHQHFTATPE